MSKESDFYPDSELQKDLTLLDAAYRSGTANDLLINDNEVVDPDIMYIFNDFEAMEDRYYHGIITSCFTSVPNDNLEENAKKFLRHFGAMKNMMILSFRESGKVPEIVESVTIEGLDAAGASDFASFYSAECELNFLCLSEDNKDYRLREKLSNYWDKMDLIIYRAHELEKLSRDPDLDQAIS